jgi:hypothetical protein
VASGPDRPKQETCCLPGDITVTKIPSGYLIGRALDPIGPGPWWSYVAIVSTFEDAQRRAWALAGASRVNVWLHKSGDDYEALPAPEGQGGTPRRA